MNMKELSALVHEYNNPKKEWIVFNRIANSYSIMDTQRKEWIEKEFWETTTCGLVYEYTKELEDELINK